MFKIQLAHPVLNLDGSEAKFQDQPLSLKQVLIKALSTVYEADSQLPPETRVYRWRLAEKAQSQDVITLTLTDVISISHLIVRQFAHPLILAHFIKTLEDSLRVASAQTGQVNGAASAEAPLSQPE